MRFLTGGFVCIASVACDLGEKKDEGLIIDPVFTYECFGECTVCIEVDTNGDCLETDIVSANVAGDEEIPKTANVSFSENTSQAELERLLNQRCKEDFVVNVNFGYPEFDIIDCNLTSYNNKNRRMMSGSDPDAGHLPVRLRGVSTLVVDESQSSLSIHDGNLIEQYPVSGKIQLRESTFSTNYFKLMLGQDIDLGSNQVYSDLILFKMQDDWDAGVVDSSGVFSIPLSTIGPRLTLQENGSWANYILNDIPPGESVTGHIDYDQRIFTMSYSLQYGSYTIDLNLTGTIANRPALARFSHTLSGCVIQVDASASTDPDGVGDIHEYYWKVNGRASGTGVIQALPLIDGVNTVELLVSDNQGITSEISSITTTASCL